MAEQFLDWLRAPVHVSVLAVGLAGMGFVWNRVVHGQWFRRTADGDGAESGGWFGDGDGGHDGGE